MSYEYKEEILLDIGPEPNCNYESESNRYYDKIDELDHVYAQAAKASEYEAKAELIDNIRDELIKYDAEAIDSLNVNYHDFGIYVAQLMDDYESGEPNA